MCYRPASEAWLSHCGPTRVVWCGVCYRPASEAWLSHCGPTRVVWCVLQASKCVMIEPLCVTGQQVWRG